MFLIDGWATWVRLLKYATLLPTMWTLPEGIGPFNISVADPRLLNVSPAPLPPVLAVAPLWVNVLGEPENLLKMTAVCHLSTIRATTPCPELRNFFPGPSGTSKIPLLVMTLVRSKLSRRLS